MGKVKFFEQAEATQEPVLLKVRTKSGSLIITPTQVRGEPVWEWLRTAQTKALKRDQITSVEHRNLGIIFGEAHHRRVLRRARCGDRQGRLA
jgi:hypothetical protein